MRPSIGVRNDRPGRSLGTNVLIGTFLPITGSGSAQALVAERPVVLPPAKRSAAVHDITPRVGIHESIKRSQDDVFRNLAEMNETVQLTRKIIYASRLAMAEVDRLFSL